MDVTLLRGTEEITNPHYLDQVLGVADRLRSGPCGSMLPCSGERPVVHVVPFCRAVGATTAKLKPLACAGTPTQPVPGALTAGILVPERRQPLSFLAWCPPM
jgi:hypothetical protein